MSLYTIVSFLPAHLRALRDAHQEILLRMPPAHPAETDPTQTIFRQADVWAVGGISRPWPGLGIAWLLCRAAPAGEEVLLGRTMVRGWPALVTQAACRRIETVVYAEFASAIRLVEVLGFRRDHVKLFYGPEGETFVSFAWIAPQLLKDA